MPGTSTPSQMPVPLGIFENGAFADGIDPAAIEHLKNEGFGGSVSQDVLQAKGTSNAAHFGMVGGDLDADNSI